MKIQAIIIDGFHKGHCVSMEYYPTVRLIHPREIKIDYCCGGEIINNETAYYDEYKECFRAVDRDIVLYSTTGKSGDILGFFTKEVCGRHWTSDTILYFGYHNEPIIRIEKDNRKKTRKAVKDMIV